MTLEWRARHPSAGFDNWLFRIEDGGQALVGEVVRYRDHGPCPEPGVEGTVFYSGFVMREPLPERFATVEEAQAAVEAAYRRRPVPPREVARRRRPT